MSEESRIDQNPRSAPVPRDDYTVISREDDGSVCIEVNIWNASEKLHDTVQMRLAPEEALLLSQMLARHAQIGWEMAEQAAAG